MKHYVLSLHQIDRTQFAAAGGKAAHLGELSRIPEVKVPAGFCVTTQAFERMLAATPSLEGPLARLSNLKSSDVDALRETAADIRSIVAATPLSGDVASAIAGGLDALGDSVPCAVRSSAGDEDSAAASFAGLQDTYLNILGLTAVLEHVQRCWASLFTERAVIYRARGGRDHRAARMAVVVQQMVFPDASGVLFTADPVTGNRRVAAVEAVPGLGEALVSGRVSADAFRIRGDVVISSAIATKPFAIVSAPGGGTREVAVQPERQARPALTDAQVIRLVRLGRRIEQHFGGPQDIEWCLAGDDVHIVQSRPITTLFPLPDARDGDGAKRVYVSVGHQQMMTDAMKPLGISVWQATAGRPMYEAGSRMFVDVAAALASPASRAAIMDVLGRSDPLIKDALQTLVERGDFMAAADDQQPAATSHTAPEQQTHAGAPSPLEADAALVARLIEQSEAALAAAKRDIQQESGPELLDFIMTDIEKLKRLLFDPRSIGVIMSVVQATWWLNDRMEAWLGEKSVADSLAQSVPHNVTSEMGLALLDVADVIRPHTEVVALLQHTVDDDFLDELPRFAGGREARDAIVAWLDRYGMRCVGEIDITRPRWSERPATLLPLLLGNIRNFEHGAGKARFEHGRREALKKQDELLTRVRALPDGEQRAYETRRVIERLRTFAGYREYPKYVQVSRYFVYRQALLEEAGRLVQRNLIDDIEDIFHLSLQELYDVVQGTRANDDVIRQRKAAFATHQLLTPPRVMTSEGEVISGAYRREGLPAGALPGLAVSAGTVEGRARVVLGLAQARFEPGDILVTTFTDPSWTPVFVSIAALVTEVGGMMTHGAVIAREYGLPTVVGVERATQLVRDGQRIRVNGTDGYVEILQDTSEQADQPAHGEYG